MFKKTFLFISTASILSAAYGCSSSSPTNNTNNDASTQPTTDAGGDTGTTGNDAAVADTGATKDTGSTGTNDAGSDTGTTAPSAPACYGATTGFTAATSVTVPGMYQGLCSVAAIQGYLEACGDNGSENACNAWLATNAAGYDDAGTGPGTACGNCIIPGMDDAGNWLTTAAVYYEPVSEFEAPNYGACIALEATSGGAACDTALDNQNDCADYACQSCTTGSTYGSCTGYATGDAGACVSYWNTYATACSAAALQTAETTCNPSGNGTSQNATFAFITNVICGSADAGTITVPDGGGSTPVDDAGTGDASGDAATGG